MNERVFITGLGVCTPLGRNLSAVWANLLAGHCGLGPITLFDASTFPVRIGGEAKGFQPEALRAVFPGLGNEPDRKVGIGLQAALDAIRYAGLEDRDLGAAAIHVGVSLEALYLEPLAAVAPSLDLARTLSRHALGTATPLQTPLDRTADLLGERFGLVGGRFTNCSACAAGAQSVGEAFHRLREGDLDLAVAGATDSALNPLGLGGFGLLRILAAENEQPCRACRPFDVTRAGTALAEGAAFVVLETATRARRRQARPIAELLGYGSSLDAYRVSDPSPGGHGAFLSMTRALRDAGLEPADIGCVNTHGTGTPKNDAVEAEAIRRLLGERALSVPAHAVKSMTGHMIATSGAFEVVVAALTLQRGAIPPTINLEHPDPECALDHVANTARAFTGRTVLSNSFGFGGQNATLILGRV